MIVLAERYAAAADSMDESLNRRDDMENNKPAFPAAAVATPRLPPSYLHEQLRTPDGTPTCIPPAELGRPRDIQPAAPEPYSYQHKNQRARKPHSSAGNSKDSYYNLNWVAASGCDHSHQTL